MLELRARDTELDVVNEAAGDGAYTGRNPGLGVPSPTDPDLDTDLSSSLSVSYPL